MSQGFLRLISRGLFLATMLVCATYALLMDIPFTYQAVFRANLFPGLPKLGLLLPWIALLTTLANIAVELRTETRASLGAERHILLALCALAAVILGLFRGLLRLQPGPSACIATVAFLLVPVLVLGLDLIENRALWPAKEPQSDDSKRLVLASMVTLGISTGTFFALATLRASAMGTPLQTPWTTLFWSLSAHGLVFFMGAVALMGTQSAAGFFPRLRGAEFLFTHVALTLLVAFLIESIVFPGIAFGGPYSWLVAVLLAFSATAFIGFAGLILGSVRDRASSALEAFLRPFHPLPNTWLALVGGLLGAIGVGVFFGVKVAGMDWNQLFQQIGAVLTAILAFAPVYLKLPTQRGSFSWAPGLYSAPLVALGIFRIWGTPITEPSSPWMPRPLTRAIERHVGFDASAHLASNLLNISESSASSIYKLLLANSNLPQGLDLKAKDLHLVENLSPTSQERPDIFVIVVDSLRQDYLGAYNKRVTFTPELDRFAAESTVVPKAFTRYGATGLSEPSIWVGGTILHKQYIIPFHPMNTLQKLIQADGYQPYVSMDSILEVVMKPDPNVIRLDAGRGTSDLRLGPTLAELQERLAKAQIDKPVFAYTQPQDVHISVIAREGKSVPGGGDFPGFYAPYAARVKRIDTQFGAFIRYLKESGRYDRSIVILTADHGDSLGEDGRFGHAYTLFPEIMKVPLILHVPERFKTNMVVDLDRPAFITDITPTLYYLLGHRPTLADPLFGRPLFTLTPEEQRRYRHEYTLLASSYGAVWGTLSGNGESLYISDAVNFTDYAYDLPPGRPALRRSVSLDLKQQNDQRIVQGIQHLNDFYGFRNSR
ncbi:MAG: sulfatase-like hydrolase/transferase [Firmicutes bacterium]|nr:sulfatase-like hydrolase/transferase [Bacillota bacterium]